PEFEAGGWKWRILLFPFGNDNPDTVSIYLDFDNLKEAPAGWHSYSNHRFTAEESDCGFTRFYDLRAPSENRIRPLIENDACNITALVHIIKDPTGVLWHDFKNEEIKAEESHLNLSTKIVIPQIFAQHQGFDLANFDDRRYPLSAIPQFKVLKSETYRNFKYMVAKRFGYSAEQIRLWVFVNRRNKTVRPDTPINDNFFGMINLRVYVNRGLGYLYVKEIDKVSDIIPSLCEKKGFPQYTPLKIYEEIKPYMIEEMKLNLTFQQSEIQDGDIICFQKSLTDK
ncbi:10384_t:CDS:2, partial [Gigaspora margarita]